MPIPHYGEMTTCIRAQSGEVCIMNPVQQVVSNPGGTSSVVPLLITDGDMRMLVEDPELVMEEIELRATEVGSVLENILREAHGQPRWGINE